MLGLEALKLGTKKTISFEFITECTVKGIQKGF
jgi:hypothetical protein